MFIKAIQELPNIKIINQKFLVAGHTHMECDIDHSIDVHIYIHICIYIQYLYRSVFWQPVSWLQYTKTHKGVLNYKTTLEENEPFKTLSFLRRGNSSTILQVKKKIQWTYTNIKGKKKDLLNLLPLIPPIFHQFYSDLKTTNETQDNEPDLDEVGYDG